MGSPLAKYAWAPASKANCLVLMRGSLLYITMMTGGRMRTSSGSACVPVISGIS